MYYVPYIYVHVKSVYMSPPPPFFFSFFLNSGAPPSDQSVGLHTGPLC